MVFSPSDPTPELEAPAHRTIWRGDTRHLDGNITARIRRPLTRNETAALMRQRPGTTR